MGKTISLRPDRNRREEARKIARKTSVEMVIRLLRQAEVLQAQGKTAVDACRELGMSEQTYYRWRKEYGRLNLDQAMTFAPIRRSRPRR